MKEKEILKSLKPKEAEFVKVYVKENENGAKAVKEVFGIESDGYARVKATRLITKDNVSQAIVMEKETIKSALEKAGVDSTKLASKVNQLLDGDNYKSVDAGLKHAKDFLGVEDKDVVKTNTNYNFFFSPEVQADVRELEERIKAKLRNAETNQTTMGTE